MTAMCSTLRQRLRDTAVRAILDAAERVMIRKGYEAATMQEIAAGAGCAAGTLYLYFRNKEILFQAVAGRHLAAMHAAGRAALAGRDEPLEAIRQACAAFMRYINGHRAFFRLFLQAMPMRIGLLRRRVDRSILRDHEEYRRAERRVIRAAQRRGQVRRDFSVRQIQDFMEAVGFSLVEQFVFASRPPSIQKQWKMLWEFIAHGIGVQQKPALAHNVAGGQTP